MESLNSARFATLFVYSLDRQVGALKEGSRRPRRPRKDVQISMIPRIADKDAVQPWS